MLIRLLINFLVVAAFACGPRPRAGVNKPDLNILPVSSKMTGLVLTSTDSSYTSSALYWYDFSLGTVTALSGVESGDLLTKWDGAKLWLFNRSAGRLSYSYLSPKGGSDSRTNEYSSLSRIAGDPTAITWTRDHIAVLLNGVEGRVEFADLGRSAFVQDGISGPATGDADVPFRPGVAAITGEDIAIFHQQLDTSWTARGAGSVFLTRKNANGVFEFADLNASDAGIQGIRLTISNPVGVFGCESDSESESESESESCYVGGVCYESFGSQCAGGVDKISWPDQVVTRVASWDGGTWAAGGITGGPAPQTAVACLSLPGKNVATLALIDLISGSVKKTYATASKYCGPFVSDNVLGRVFLVDQSNLLELNQDLTLISSQSLPWTVSGLEAVNE